MKRLLIFTFLIATCCVNMFPSTASQSTDSSLSEEKPIIRRVFNAVIKEGTTPVTYNYQFSVDYAGADWIEVSVRQEYSYDNHTFMVVQPSIADIEVKDIYRYGYAWIDLTVKNEYGSASYTIELPPLSDKEIEMPNGDAGCTTPQQHQVAHIDVYSANGIKITRVNDINEMDNLCERHKIMILRYIDPYGNLIRSQVFKQP